MAKEFYNDLINYVSKSDTSNANALLMTEVGKSLAKDKSNFIELLTSSGVPANDSMSDIELIDAFIGSLPSNKSLMIGTAYTINKKNAFLNADGEEQVSDNGVKVTYKVLYDYYNNPEYYSNLAADPVSAIAQGVGALANLGTAGIGASQKRKYGATDALTKQAESRSQLVQSVLAQRQAETLAKQKAVESKAKTKKILLIGGASLIGLVLIGIIVYKIKNK
jgi:hypothetical protein